MPRASAVKKAPNNSQPVPPIEAEKVVPENIVPNSHTPMTLAFDDLWKAIWEGLPMQQAQDAYRLLQDHYQKAGKILNERMHPKTEQFYCFMGGSPGACPLGKIYEGKPVFRDLAYRAPKGGYKNPITGVLITEGLDVPVSICSERCFHLYNALLIEQRRERMRPEVNG
jgi:hypothetical protein